MAAINKRKILESAQRNLQKGALDKALKDYQAVLEADPRDTNVRLKYGDLLQRAGRNDEAISAYLKVADQFQRDGFDAKAVALYKQVTKIDSKRHDVYVPLADLYQRLGLVSEAMGALQTAAEACQRDGRKREALDLLRRMASLDPANVTSRLKVAELLKQEGLTDEAVAEFREAAAELERQGDWEARVGALERVVELRPGVEELDALATTWLDQGQARRAHAFAQKLVEADASRPESHEVLARVLAALGQQELANDAFRQCAEAWRVRGEEGKAREIMQRHLPTQDFASLGNGSAAPEVVSGGGAAAAELFGSAGELGAEPAAGEGVFGSEPIEVGGDGVVELGGDEAPFDPGAVGEVRIGDEPAPPEPEVSEPARPAAAAPPAAAPPPAAPARAAAPAAEGDVEQLLAEAAVYTRYGKHERALACLEAALAQEPAHGAALEQLGEVHAAAGAPERAVEAWSRAATLAADARDAARFAVLRSRIEALDPSAAGALQAPLPPGAPAPTVLFETSHPDLGPPGELLERDAGDEAAEEPEDLDEIEIDLDEDALAAEEGAAEAPAADVAGAAGEVELDLELDGDDAAGATARATHEDVEGAEDEPDALETQAPEPPAAAPERAGATPSAAPSEDEEIVFDGEDSAPLPEAEDDEPPAPREEAWELPFDEEEEAEEAPPSAVPPPAAEAAVPDGVDPQALSPAAAGLSVSAAQQIQEELEEGSFYFDQGLLAEAEAVYRRILARAPGHPGALLRLGEIAVQRGGTGAELPAAPEQAPEPSAAPEPALAAGAVPVEEAPEIEPPDALDLTAPTLDDTGDWSGTPVEPDDSTAGVVTAAPGPESLDDTTLRPTPAPPAAREEPELTAPDVAQEEDPAGPAFDLAAELSEALSDDAAPASDDGFASLFREFKRGVSQTLGEGDVETHFDLGIAYREMGLLEDAIGEFRYALGSPVRRLDALQMMGLCALDLGRAQDAVGHLEQALASPEVPAEREAPLRYELGRAYQAVPDRVRALGALRRVCELDPEFQDARDRLAALERGDDGEAEEAPAEEAEAFESFDDLVAEAAESAAPAPEPAAPAYESFDDVVAEANDEDEAEPGEAAAPPGEPAGEAALDAETEAAFLEATAENDDTSPAQEPTPLAREPEPQPAEPAAPAQRRRRKVSFV